MSKESLRAKAWRARTAWRARRGWKTTNVGEDLFRAAFRAELSAAWDALNRTRDMAIMATAQGEDLEARDYYAVHLYEHVNHAIAVLATLQNTTLSKILGEIQKTVGNDEIFRRDLDARIEKFRRQPDDS